MSVLITFGAVLVALIIFFVVVVLPARKRRWAMLAAEDKKRIDDSMGTWAPESMIARDRKRGYGTFAKSKGVRE